MLLGERGPSEGVAGESCANPRGSAASSRSKLIFCICGTPVTDAGSGQQTVAGDSGASLMTEAIRAARLGVWRGSSSASSSDLRRVPNWRAHRIDEGQKVERGQEGKSCLHQRKLYI